MVVETVPKDILDKLETGVKVVNPAGVGLNVLSFGSTDGGTTWFPVQVNASGVVEVKQASTKTHNVYTFNEYLADNGTFRASSGGAFDSTTTLYTVPANKIFYLNSIVFGWLNRGVPGFSNDHPFLVAGNEVARIRSSMADNDHDVVSITFSNPIKMSAAQTIQITSEEDKVAVEGSFTGYEVDA